MNRFFTHGLVAPALLASLPALAQEVVQPLPGTTPADKLADTMRRVGSNPTDVDALVSAGEQTLALGDLSGAASLFARADKINPRLGRVKAGLASILVRSERPGEALRFYQQAEQLGQPAASFAADRGLAYDLVGDQARAQADYRLALASDPDEETVRRYALSLGISGNQKDALSQLDPLLRKTDRGAWRARAFVMAMAGNVTEASRIANTMMPGQMATGLAPFFARLPALAPADRAFAVHFGEVHATPERIADARLAPQLPPLAPAPTPPVAVAAVGPVPSPAPTRERGRRSGRRTASPPAPSRVAPAVDLASAGATLPSAPAVPVASTSPLRQQTVPAPAPTTPAVRTASAGTPPIPAAQPSARPPVRIASLAPVIQPIAAPPLPTRFSTGPSTTALPVTGEIARHAATPVASSVAVVRSTPPPRAVQPAVPTRAPVSRSGADAILAKIIAGLTIPASELDVKQPRSRADEGSRVIAEAEAKTRRDEVTLKAADRIAARTAKRDADTTTAATGSKVAADIDGRRGRPSTKADGKDGADKKPDAKKLAATKKDAEEKKAAKANPSRFWVQVAGGANEDDLPKAWNTVRRKSPDLAKRKAFKTPLRATHRVLTGPFKTAEEAQAFVNTLRKDGVEGFSFTSDKGQAITPLPAK